VNCIFSYPRDSESASSGYGLCVFPLWVSCLISGVIRWSDFGLWNGREELIFALIIVSVKFLMASSMSAWDFSLILRCEFLVIMLRNLDQLIREGLLLLCDEIEAFIWIRTGVWSDAGSFRLVSFVWRWFGRLEM